MTDVTITLKNNEKQALSTDVEENELLKILNTSRFIKFNYYDGEQWKSTLVNTNEIVSIDF
ncbi:hypothetical protein RE433_29345 (plasmid) [Bacillus cereus]|uniref:hypothetical protein n=1 Tax=Bacillus cereus TaxID=1396 RepID=UPI002867C9BA|nr:hypothetical protein [Bacillus cereus]WMW41358.1 hypothetical protein RE433_29345 [Bacillus cereus]